MATGDDLDLVEAVVTCEGNLHDPDFSERFQVLVGKLKSLIYCKSKFLRFTVILAGYFKFSICKF